MNLLGSWLNLGYTHYLCINQIQWQSHTPSHVTVASDTLPPWGGDCKSNVYKSIAPPPPPPSSNKPIFHCLFSKNALFLQIDKSNMDVHLWDSKSDEFETSAASIMLEWVINVHKVTFRCHEQFSGFRLLTHWVAVLFNWQVNLNCETLE